MKTLIRELIQLSFEMRSDQALDSQGFRQEFERGSSRALPHDARARSTREREGARRVTEKEAGLFYIPSSSVRLGWGLEEPNGPKGRPRSESAQASSAEERRNSYRGMKSLQEGGRGRSRRSRGIPF